MNITLAYHDHLKYIIHITVHSWCYNPYSVGLDNCIMMCTHHYGIIPNIFHYLKNPLCSSCSTLFHTNPGYLLVFLLSSWFCLVQNAMQLEAHRVQPFQSGFFHLVICIYVSSTSFHDSIMF